MMTAAAKRTAQPVRRESLDVDDPRAQVFRPIEGGIAYVDALLAAFDEWADQIKIGGKRHELTANCGRVLAVLLRKCTDFQTGVCEPCLDTLMAKTRFARATVVRCLALLRRHGFLDWVRRTVPTDNLPGEGPQVRQVSNAYFFDLALLPKRVAMHLASKMRKKGKPIEIPREPRMSVFRSARKRYFDRRREKWADRAASLAEARTPAEKAAVLYPGDEAQQAAWLELQGASSDCGLNPPSSIKGEAD